MCLTYTSRPCLSRPWGFTCHTQETFASWFLPLLKLQMLLREVDYSHVLPTTHNSNCELHSEHLSFFIYTLLSYLLSVMWFNYLHWHFNKLLWALQCPVLFVRNDCLFYLLFFIIIEKPSGILFVYRHSGLSQDLSTSKIINSWRSKHKRVAEIFALSSVSDETLKQTSGDASVSHWVYWNGSSSQGSSSRLLLMQRGGLFS